MASALVSIVIIIGITITLVGLVFVWGSDFVKQAISTTEIETLKEITCAGDVSIDISKACYNYDNARVVLESSSDIAITRFLLLLDVNDEQIPLHTSVGLDPYGVKPYTLSDISDDLTEASRSLLSDIVWYEGVDGVTALPAVSIEGEEVVCKNFLLSATRFSCCSDDCDFCDVDGDCDNVCDPISHLCVECVDSEDCDPGYDCVGNVCVEEPLGCGDVSFILGSVPDSGCADGTQIKLEISGISTVVSDFKIEYLDSSSLAYQTILAKSGTDASLTVDYGVEVLRNNVMEQIRITPRINGGLDECGSEIQTSSLLVSGTTDTFICCDSAIECDSSGQSGTCCEKDCGQNPYINSELWDAGFFNDDCTLPSNCIAGSTACISEQYCDGGLVSPTPAFIDCSNEVCGAGSHECLFA